MIIDGVLMGFFIFVSCVFKGPRVRRAYKVRVEPPKSTVNPEDTGSSKGRLQQELLAMQHRYKLQLRVANYENNQEL